MATHMQQQVGRRVDHRPPAASLLTVAALALTAVLAALVVMDGESTWLEGLALIGLYAILAASVWWGQPIG